MATTRSAKAEGTPRKLEKLLESQLPEPVQPSEGIAAPAASAAAVGLRYVSDLEPGIRRVRSGGGFRYLRPDGQGVKDQATLARIRALAIPPAYTDVWICGDPVGHLQASGRDDRGRKQYRYHERWREVRDAVKFHRMMAFGEALPGIRRRVAADLRRPGLPREKVLATVVAMLEQTLVRVGNDEYAQQNQSFGLTTLGTRHVSVSRGQARFQFKGKSGKQHDVTLDDPRLVAVVRRCLDVPGYDLFQWIEDDGQRHSVDSGAVNQYLREITGDEFTAKDFRTWAGTVLAARLLRASKPGDDERQARGEVARVIKDVAAELRNTPAVCRKCYVHPAVVDAFLSGKMKPLMDHRGTSAGRGSSPREETELLKLLSQGAETVASGLAARKPRPSRARGWRSRRA